MSSTKRIIKYSNSIKQGQTGQKYKAFQTLKQVGINPDQFSKNFNKFKIQAMYSQTWAKRTWVQRIFSLFAEQVFQLGWNSFCEFREIFKFFKFSKSKIDCTFATFGGKAFPIGPFI